MGRGFTLLEIVVALALLGVMTSLAVPPLRSLGDRLAVAGAREAAAGLFARARAEAPLEGGLEMVVEEHPAGLRIEAGPDTIAGLDLARAFGVSLDLGGTASTVRLRYDGLGIGRVTSRTLLFHKGNARALLVVSAYGRVSRR